MKKILITGGAGYIGSHTVFQLAKQKDYSLVIFDNLKNGNLKSIEIIKRHTECEIEVIQGELLDKDKINKVIKDTSPEFVIHFAALIEAGKSVIEPIRFYENNITGSVNLLEAMQNNNVKNIVFSSTAAVYGTPDDSVVDENTPTSPENPYGESKLVVENILRSLSNENVPEDKRIRSIILRYFNAAGANPNMLIGQDYPNPTHLITVAIQAALGYRDSLTIFGKDYPTADGTCIRDYIHVEDLANAHVLALDKFDNIEGSEVFNVGTGKGTSNLEVVKYVEKITGEFNWKFGERRAGDPVSYFADSSKIQSRFGWSPKYSVEDAIQHAYNWLDKFPNGYDDIQI